MPTEAAATVIVSTRNRAHYLRDCLESLSRQKCNEVFEVLVIDNGSTDETPRVIEEWCNKDPHFRTFRETRIGLSAAKNAGARLARGRLLLFTDDDVVVEPNWIRAYLDLFGRIGEENAIAGGPIIPVLNDLSQWPGWFDEQALPETGLLDYHSERPLRWWEYVWGANMAIPASVFLTIGPWNEQVGRRGDDRGTFEDTEYQDRLRAAGGAVWFCPKGALRHRIEPDRIRPRKLMERAFIRGRNEFLRETLRSNGDLGNPQRQKAGPALLALALSLSTWVFWTFALRFARNRSIFCRTHTAAFCSGNCLERMRAGRAASRVNRALIKGAFVLRSIALRLTSNAAD